MKKISMLFCVGVLMSALCTGFVACNKSQGTEQKDPEPPEVIGVSPVPVSNVPKEIAAFFEENPEESFSFKFLDKFEQIEGYDPVCLTINSLEEFRAATSSSVELPYIDFDDYTLVVGQYYTSGGTYLKSQSINKEPDVMIFNLIFGDTGKGLTAMFKNFFWTLYPKLPQKAITFNVVTIKEYE